MTSSTSVNNTTTPTPELPDRTRQSFYKEGKYTVSTELKHLQRGWCCGNKCRHCPWEGTKIKEDVVKALLSLDNLSEILTLFPPSIRKKVLYRQKPPL